MIDYIGSKAKLIDWLFDQFQQHCGPIEDKTFMDGCAGTGAVSFKAKELGAKVYSNDIMFFSPIYIAGYSNIANTLTAKENLINNLNKSLDKEGFFYKNYSENSGRPYFTDYNAKKIDGIRESIDSIEELELRNYALACLLEAVSRVSNTAGTHGAFLKQIKQRALESILLRCEPARAGKHLIQTSRDDLLHLLQKTPSKLDILYLDPPYTSRQYAPNYHLYETLVKNDSPDIHGKTGLRDWQEEADSSFCREKIARQFFKDIFSAAQSKFIFVSYSSDGLLTKDEMLQILQESRPDTVCSVTEMPYKRYKADSTRQYCSSELFEYLFVSKDCRKSFAI